MKLHSQSFDDQGVIPEKLAFGRPDETTKVTLAGNHNPHLAWENVPEGTRSFVVMCIDPDVPSVADDVNVPDKEISAQLERSEFYHWVLIDVPGDTREIEEGAYSNRVTPRGKAGPLAPGGTRQGVNDFTNFFAHDRDMSGDYFGYDGPCPPWNDALVHRYYFMVYALDVAELPLTGRFTSNEVKAAMATHVIGQASIHGTYTLNPSLLKG